MIEAPPSPKPSAQPRAVSGGSSPMIAVRSLAKKIGQQEILRGVDLEVATGETLAIIGRSGGGKSVLLKHLVGLMEPDAGEIWIEGQNIIGMNERQLGTIRKKVGILFQGGALFDSMTVEENIAFPLHEAGERDPNVLRAKVTEMLDVMEMEGEQAKMPESLSGGMKKRVGLARSIIRRPSCVLYDEPTSGLDPVVADSINRLILSATTGSSPDVGSSYNTQEGRRIIERARPTRFFIPPLKLSGILSSCPSISITSSISATFARKTFGSRSPASRSGK